MGFSAPSIETSVFATVDFDCLPARLDDAQLAQVTAIANARLPVVVAAEEKFISGCLRAMSVMPKRPDDETSGAVRNKMYKRHLTGFSCEALTHLVDEALRSHQFFPSIAECLAILHGWPSQQFEVRQQRRAQARLDRERQARFDEIMSRLAAGECGQAEIDALPERWKAVAETRSYLWRHEDGSYTSRVRQ